MAYRTKTYISADWTGDKNAVDQLNKWNDSGHWGLSFHDAHDITEANDGSLNCSIKSSLATRMDASKTFVLIIGNGTKSRRAGECNYCSYYNYGSCKKSHSISNKSFIEYECDKAVLDGITIVVLYNAAKVDKTKCHDVVKDKGTHTAMQYIENGQRYWDYQAVKKAMGQ
jgi:hypothetical protein